MNERYTFLEVVVLATMAFWVGDLRAELHHAGGAATEAIAAAASRQAWDEPLRATAVGADTMVVDISAAELTARAGTPALLEAIGVRPSDIVVAIDGRTLTRAGTDALTDLHATPASFRELDLVRDGARLRLLVIAH